MRLLIALGLPVSGAARSHDSLDRDTSATASESFSDPFNLALQLAALDDVALGLWGNSEDDTFMNCPIGNDRTRQDAIA
ncbi:hypothetical protein FHX06_006759 [Rhizobium sp. BK512]|uniref:hypothetical protein n=1 Tax=Rhizobium sp. BK512 TaxID=2587010 RepID=UPI00161281F8|nr:hypothetical protein [Rhizobium sp. BK512]MBB3565389.1 hypothetical protein [Rhizobium sp. BK512]